MNPYLIKHCILIVRPFALEFINSKIRYRSVCFMNAHF